MMMTPTTTTTHHHHYNHATRDKAWFPRFGRYWTTPPERLQRLAGPASAELCRRAVGRTAGLRSEEDGREHARRHPFPHAPLAREALQGDEKPGGAGRRKVGAQAGGSHSDQALEIVDDEGKHLCVAAATLAALRLHKDGLSVELDHQALRALSRSSAEETAQPASTGATQP